jgi:erythromycin esterase-like protein
MGTLRDQAWPLDEAGVELLLDHVGDARIVLIGEASHGTHEFYEQRARITKELIGKRGFVAVAAEADWPDAWRLNRYVRSEGSDPDAERGLGDFVRFPSWMWRNRVVLAFAEWLRERNTGLPPRARAGFFGLDVYSLRSSVEAVLGYLKDADPAAYERARDRYSCLDHTADDGQRYGYRTKLGLDPSCEDDVVAQLLDLRSRSSEYLSLDGRRAEDAYFYAEQNARVVANAEAYYRAMFGPSAESWNLRDTHMADTLDALVAYLGSRTAEPKVVVWAHNSHVGDARATALGAAGELNIGQLARQRHPGDTYIIGFTTYTGTVTASSDWGGIAERKHVRPALAKSYEDVLHRAGLDAHVLTMDGAASDELHDVRLERAIGVIYRPETERASHYFGARLAEQFDAVIHIDETHAVEPLERTSTWEEGELPETYPWAV